MRHSGIRALATAIAVYVLATACSDSPEYVIVDATVRDSAGVRIIENPDTGTLASWSLSAEPLLEVGEPEIRRAGLPPGRFTDARMLPDGRLAVIVSYTSQILLLSPDGEPLETVGTHGPQPGQFMRLTNVLAMRDGAVGGFDTRNMNVEVFDREGRLIRSFGLEAGRDYVPQRLIGLADESMLLVTQRSAQDHDPEGIVRPEAPVMYFNREGKLEATLGYFPGKAWIRDGDTLERLPYGPNTHVAARQRHIYVTRGDHYQVEAYDLKGELQRMIRVMRQQRPVTQKDKDAHRDRIMGGYFGAEVPVGELDPDILEVLDEAQVRALLAQFQDEQAKAREEMQEALDSTIYPETLPAYAMLIVDDSGNIWAKRYQPITTEATEWDVFNAGGQLIAEITMPAPFRPFQIEKDLVLGRWLDESDVERLRAYRLERLREPAQSSRNDPRAPAAHALVAPAAEATPRP